MLELLHLDVTYICNGFQMFIGIFASVSSVFFCMMQLLHIDVSKVERVLRMGYVWEVAGDTDDVRGGVGNVRAT
jgi:hypothetical protein